MGFEFVAAAAAMVAGAIASVAGFGIGSVLTPLLTLRVGAKLAVAAVSIPHVIGTAVRFWLLRGHVDRRIFVWFGVTSAAGGLAGALVHAYASNRVLAVVFGCLLMFVGFSELTGFMHNVRLGRRAAWIAGAISGVFGGLVGNQGGIRSAALLAFDTEKEAFVATATAVGLVVDAARMPVYLATERSGLLQIWPLIAISIVGVVAGTLLGTRVLRKLPDRVFRWIVAVLLLALGTWMLFSSGGSPVSGRVRPSAQTARRAEPQYFPCLQDHGGASHWTTDDTRTRGGCFGGALLERRASRIQRHRDEHHAACGAAPDSSGALHHARHNEVLPYVVAA